MALVYLCCVGLFLVILFTNNGFEFVVAANVHPSQDFKHHTTIIPTIYHEREKRQIPSISEKNDKHHLSITYNVNDKEYILDLQLNTDLIPKDYFTKYQQNGENIINSPKSHEIELCHYKGNVRGVPNSWVALSTCNEGRLSGVVFDGLEMHYIENSNDKHFLYKHSDIIDEHNKTCGYHEEKGDHNYFHQKPNRMLRYKRGAEVKGPFNSNRQSRYVELVLVADNTEYKEMGENIGRVEQHLKSIANIMNGLYSSLNIFIALVGIIVWTERDEVTFSTNGDVTLTNFLHYRREKLLKDHPNDNAQLLTKFTFEHGVVGKALKGPMCTIEYSGGVNTDHSPVVGLVATTIAHEMGHNFGMEHDTSECECPDDRCIMAPSSSSIPPLHWSSCSLEYLALAFEHGMDYCLRNKPLTLFDSPLCGNGFVEHGEQCDCGLPDKCDNPCCNATTCMLYNNATCATGECCDLQTCRPKPASTLCRSAEYECDLPEYCTGESEFCPIDIYKMDTEVCDDGKAYCYKGLCRTHSDQCKLLWGETGRSSDDQCYTLNGKGTRHGNCGYNKLNQTFSRCRDEDVFCGMLHCKHLSERLEFGMESVAILSHSFINVKGSVVPCRTAIIDLGINQIDPGLTPDGAKCGDDKMCVNQKCLSVASLRANSKDCDNSCNGNGVCNSLGHCHCKDGFSPPYCDYPGFGGSVDSGPTSDPNARKDFVIALFVIFLGIIPALAIIGFLLYYTKYNVCLTLKRKSIPPPKKSPQKPRGATPFQTSAQSKEPEDNSLLHDKQDDLPPLPGFKHEFFGNFKGFSLTPLKLPEVEPVRPAPPVPKAVQRSTSAVTSSQPPALPPANQGLNSRPLISSPILENSTCTAKELLSPLKNVPRMPVRPAPDRPLSTPINTMVATIITDVNKKPKESTINRIASFLKSEKPTTVIKATKVLDKSSLRGIEISNPILQTEITIPTVAVDVATKPVIMRAQSMRGNNVTKRPTIPNFGSMRSSHKRPVSIPAASRPKSPPPRPPPVKVPTLPGYQAPSAKSTQNEYDDCLNSDKSPTSDNIYAVIDETPVISPGTASGSSENVSLLGEIVSEIQIRNEDSIYSTSTLNRKKSEAEPDTYVNTSSIYKVPENNYSNMDNFKSSASSTSSGYIAPSAINAPPAKPLKVATVKPTLSTFKSGPAVTKPITKVKTIPTSPTVKTPVKPLNKQLSGGNLRSSFKQATPVRVTPPPSNNSPDLVTSCSGENNSKSPDVLNTSVKKPNMPKKYVPPSKVTKPNPEIKKNVARNNSNVAALQQKFENKPTIGTRTATVSNKK